jgi:hypothetical protein
MNKIQYIFAKHTMNIRNIQKSTQMLSDKKMKLSINCVIFVAAYKAAITHFVRATTTTTIRIIITVTAFWYAFDQSLRITLCTRARLHMGMKVCGTKSRSAVIATSKGIVITS